MADGTTTLKEGDNQPQAAQACHSGPSMTNLAAALATALAQCQLNGTAEGMAGRGTAPSLAPGMFHADQPRVAPSTAQIIAAGTVTAEVPLRPRLAAPQSPAYSRGMVRALARGRALIAAHIAAPASRQQHPGIIPAGASGSVGQPTLNSSGLPALPTPVHTTGTSAASTTPPSRPALHPASVRASRCTPDLAALIRAAHSHSVQRRYTLAKVYYRASITISTQRLGAHHPETLCACLDLATCLIGQGSLAAAQAVALDVLEAGQSQSDGSWRNFFMRLATNHMAYCALCQGQYDIAESLYRPWWQASVDTFGPGNPNRLMLARDVAFCLICQQRHSEAAVMYQEMASKTGRPEPTLMLALCLSNQGRHAAAEPLYRKVLKVWRRVYGHDHPRTLTLSTLLADSITAQGKHDLAEHLYLRVYAYGRQGEGMSMAERHGPWRVSQGIVRTCAWAACLRHQGRWAEAVDLYWDAWNLGASLLGAGDPCTVTAAWGVADCLSLQQRHVPAELMYREVLSMRRTSLGPDHPDTLAAASALASCLDAQKQHPAAERMHTFVVEARRHVQGPQHPDTLTAISRLAQCISSQGEYIAAESMHRDVLEARRRALGPNHPDTLASLVDLAHLFTSQGQWKDARGMIQQALAVGLRALGSDCAKTVELMFLLGTNQCRLGEYAKAVSLFWTAARLRGLCGSSKDATREMVKGWCLLGHAMARAGKLNDAKAVLTPAVELAFNKLGPKHEITGCLVNELVTCLMARRKEWKDASRLRHRALIEGCKLRSALACLL